MTEDERTNLLALMYDDEKKIPGAKKPNEVPDQNRKTRRVVMGAVAYEVPTVEYVENLEKKIAQQERTIFEQSRQLKRIESSLIILKQSIRKNNSNLNEIALDLDYKIDRRDR
jgi:septal ring factor EnvC (AmiA/AmiB activator)